MRPDAGRVAGGIDFRKHLYAPAMYAARCIGRMMMRQDQRALEILGFDALQGRLEVGDLGVANRAVGYDARILQGVGVEGQYAHKGRFESVEHTRLNLGGGGKTPR